MRRRALGRDLGLSVRMVEALGGAAAIYLLAAGLLAFATVEAFRDGEPGAGLGFLLFLAAIPLALVQQLWNAPGLVLRAPARASGGMAALQKIGGAEPRGDLRGGPVVSAFRIVPAQRRRSGRLGVRRRIEIFMDHPPLEKRLARLGAIAQEVGNPV